MLHFYLIVFFKTFLWLCNEQLNKLPLVMKHVAWVFSVCRLTVTCAGLGQKQCGGFESACGFGAAADKTFQPAQDSSSYRVNAKWSRCSGSIARRARVNVASLGRNSPGWMPARIERLSAGVGHWHPVTIGKASLMAESARRLWALRQQEGTQYSAVE